MTKYLLQRGDKNDPIIYRGICLLTMWRHVVARIAAVRVGKWAKDMGLLDDNQASF